MTKITVLVVEDELLIRMGFVNFLLDEGFDVLEANNADEAIVHLETNDRIQIMFTDIDMPGTMDGLKLSAAVRGRWPPVKIVVMSGKHLISSSDLPEGSLFYTKPYDSDGLLSSLRDLSWVN